MSATLRRASRSAHVDARGGPVVPVTLVTGSAGFLGFHLVQRLRAEGVDVVGVDNLNPYYDVALKKARTEMLLERDGFEFVHLDLADVGAVAELFERVQPTVVIHMAAQAGVRYSLDNPHVYVDSNVTGFLNVLEGCRRLEHAPHLVYASSSSVYGDNTEMPFSESHKADRQVSLYGATKKANESMAYAYAHLFGFPVTGLRFFTVYGPWGRPDMAYYLFTRRILEQEPIRVFNHGAMKRDFTYVDDVVEGVVRVARQPFRPADGSAPHKLYNIGRGEPVALGDFIIALEDALGLSAIKNFESLQPGDVVATWADTTELERDTGYRPTTSIQEGCRRFVDWYRQYHGV